MRRKQMWAIPQEEQPAPQEVEFDLDRTLHSIVHIDARVPTSAFTAHTLGIERVGSGVLIRDEGIVLTIGYLVTEAEDVTLTDHKGRQTPAHPIAVDSESGFALLKALGTLDLPTLPVGSSATVKVGEPVIMAGGHGTRQQACRARIVARQEFSGFWEYHLDEALFTAPAHPLWAGSSLIGIDGQLIGIGSLHVQQSGLQTRAQDVNMSVPIDVLPPILDDLLTLGQRKTPARPWLGLYSTESRGRVVIADVAETAPAEQAGLRAGDIIVSVRDAPIEKLADFYREIWACGEAGAEIPIEIIRDRRSLWVRAKSANRRDFLHKPRLN